MGANRKDQMNFSCVTDLKMLHESCIGGQEERKVKSPYDFWIWKGQFNLTSNYVFQDGRAIKDCENGRWIELRYSTTLEILFYLLQIFILEIKMMQMIC